MSRGSRPPAVAVVLAAAGALLVALPVAALLVRVPWTDLGAEIGRGEVRDALRLSLVTSAVAAVASAALGIPLAFVYARTSFPAKRALRAVTVLPMVLPPVVGGIALLLALGRRGVVGQYLDSWFGLELPFTTAAVVVAQTFVSMPFLVVTAEAGFRNVDLRYEEAARTLGAGRWTVLRRVTLPLAWPSLAAGVVLAWARALGEFGATITFAGNLRGTTQTMPVAAFEALEAGRTGSAVTISALLLVVSGAVLVALRDRWLGAA